MYWCVRFLVIFGIYASETFPLMSKVAVDRMVLETEGVVSHGLAELFRQVDWLLSLVIVRVKNAHTCLAYISETR